jgi:chorismate mutase
LIRGVRGATTVVNNVESEIVSATENLLTEMISKNDINPEQVTSIFISVTEDITAAFPAKTLRRFDGWSHVPVMCMREIPVPGSLEFCIRIMMHIDTIISQPDIQHVYLENASNLRVDLMNNEN